MRNTEKCWSTIRRERRGEWKEAMSMQELKRIPGEGLKTSESEHKKEAGRGNKALHMVHPP